MCPLSGQAALLRPTFPRSGLTPQKPRLTPSASLVPGLRLYDPDLTVHTNQHLLVSGLTSSLVPCIPGPPSKIVEENRS